MYSNTEYTPYQVCGCTRADIYADTSAIGELYVVPDDVLMRTGKATSLYTNNGVTMHVIGVNVLVG